MKSQDFFWATNIKHLRNRKKMSQDDLAEQLGISRSKLNAHENGQSRNPTVEDLIKFSEFFKMSIDSLIKVDLSKLSELKIRELEAGNDVYVTGSKIRILATTVDARNRENIELVPVKAKAGYLAGYSDPDFISKLPSFHLPQLPRDRKYRMFPTTGDSMYPVPENAFVIGEYVEDWTTLKDETPCIVITREEGIVFKLVSNRMAEDKTLLLASLNVDYAPYRVPVGEVLEIWLFRSYLSDAMPDEGASMQQLARTVSEIKSDLKKLMGKG
jgi:transcriptional regulator with XRE-family HTH domain